MACCARKSSGGMAPAWHGAAVLARASCRCPCQRFILQRADPAQRGIGGALAALPGAVDRPPQRLVGRFAGEEHRADRLGREFSATPARPGRPPTLRRAHRATHSSASRSTSSRPPQHRCRTASSTIPWRRPPWQPRPAPTDRGRRSPRHRSSTATSRRYWRAAARCSLDVLCSMMTSSRDSPSGFPGICSAM